MSRKQQDYKIGTRVKVVNGRYRDKKGTIRSKDGVLNPILRVEFDDGSWSDYEFMDFKLRLA